MGRPDIRGHGRPHARSHVALADYDTARRGLARPGGPNHVPGFGSRIVIPGSQLSGLA